MPTPISNPLDERLRSRPRIASTPGTRPAQSSGDREISDKSAHPRCDRRIGHKELPEECAVEQQRLLIGERTQETAQRDGAV